MTARVHYATMARVHCATIARVQYVTAVAIWMATLLGATAWSSPAHAFSDPSSFAAHPAAAGGGGRYFTGSPADGYTCAVCHQGGEEPAVRVLGLPIAGYKPGGAYEIVVDWPDTLDKISGALEITDLNGKPAGELRLPPQAELLPAEVCEPVSDLIPAASLVDTTDGRHVVTLPDCGAKQLRLLWIAPSVASERVWFAGSLVVSNGEADVTGDGVTAFAHVLAPMSSGESSVALETSAGCSVERVAGHARGLWLPLTLMAAWFIRRRAATRAGLRTRRTCQ